MNDVYWIGQDGNIWFKGEGGVTNRGAASGGQFTPTASGLVDNFADYAGQPGSVIPARQIADPALQQSAPAPSGGSGGTPRPQLNQVAVDNTLGSIRAVDDMLGRNLAQDQARFNETQQLLSGQRGRQQQSFDEGVVGNNQNYGRNLMASVGAGARGLRGLMEALGGAGRGSMGDWAREAVGRQTASDIQTGADTQQENQTALESTLNTNLDTIRERERENELTRANNEAAFRRERASELQRLYQSLSGLYGDADNTAKRDEYLQQSGSYTPDISRYSTAERGTYNATPSNIQAADLSDYSGASTPKMSATPDANGEIGAGIFTVSKERRRLAGQAV